jgi:NTE family protein
MPPTQQHHHARHGFTVVIGGGGAVAVAHACGALKALRDVGGVDLNAAKLMIGTSAGSMIAADLRLGRTVEDIAEAVFDQTEQEVTIAKAWSSKPDLARRVIGSAYVMTRSSMPLRMRMLEPPRIVQRAFPGSLMRTTSNWASDRYPQEWPAGGLWITAFDVDSSRRVVLHSEHRFHASLPDAVRASCAVPGIYSPVRLGGRRLVDGGSQSATNIDLAARTGSAAVIALASMAYEPTERPGVVTSLMRMRPSGQVRREADRVRRSGAAVLVLRPGAKELEHHKLNILSAEGAEAVYHATYEAVAGKMESAAAERVLKIVHQTQAENGRA